MSTNDYKSICVSTLNYMGKPLPNNFDEFLPWASTQLEFPIDIIVTRTLQSEYVRTRTRLKGKSRADVDSAEKDESAPGSPKNAWQQTLNYFQENAVNVVATYDAADHLVNIKLDSNLRIPRQLFKILHLIIKFYPHLTGITIKEGLHYGLIHEMRTLLPISCITDVCLDNTFVKEGNYHVLLETPGNLKFLSLSRCRINDTVVGNMAAYLQWQAPASKTLSILNLSTNEITDLGAQHLSKDLRSNRKLSYLNLSDNMIKDDGAICLFEIMIDFTLTNEEILDFKHRYVQYLRGRNAIISTIFKELKQGQAEKKTRKQTMKPPPPNLGRKGKAVQNEPSGRNIGSRGFFNLELMLEEQANNMVEAILGPFDDPFSSSNTYLKDNLTHCFGNNSLCYLNLAYNSLTFVSLQKVLDVVIRQKMYERKPRGLVCVCIEGNPMPKACVELTELNELLEMGLVAITTDMSHAKKKQTHRGRNA